MQKCFLLTFDAQSSMKRLGICRLVEFVLFKIAFSFTFYAQSPIKKLGIDQVA